MHNAPNVSEVRAEDQNQTVALQATHQNDLQRLPLDVMLYKTVLDCPHSGALEQ